MKFSTSHWILGLIAATGMALTNTANAQDAGVDLGAKVNAATQNAEQAVDVGAKAAGEVTPPATPEVPANPAPEVSSSTKGLTDSIEGSAKTEADVDPSIDASAPNFQNGPADADVNAKANVDADVNVQPMADGSANAAVDVDAKMRNRDRNQGDRNARWRYKNQNGVWWYWTPSNYWMVYRNGNWNRYQGPGYGHGGSWYDNYQPRTTTGYRGSPYSNGMYYRDNDGMRFYYNQGQRYYFDNNGRYYFGPNGSRTYDRQYANPDTIRGANTGAAIGGAIGGQRGAQIGAGIGGAIGAGSR
ncbi:hypothetical protein [Blastopirellula marina]|uniref:YMGG-like Gly-zipper domain-containing protein n=1 Tax=Blastopirellula marina TaxID=124 RepID=A0A2S8G1T4_9BACT|nr:hypothetical protein [Blastopirellula marina]PQO38407.1 hypothetical protein C5Y98_10105 [Blastopirellula marina]PTL45064.1 hypothetical protein C5Y97_10115 [Blastopirellula marina]